MKVSEAYIELFPQLNAAFANTIRTDTTRIGEQAGQALSEAIASSMSRNERSITQAAERTGTASGQALVNQLARTLQNDRTIEQRAAQTGQAAGQALADETARRLNAESNRIAEAGENAGREAGEAMGEAAASEVGRSATDIANEAQRRWMNSLGNAGERAGERAGEEMTEAAADEIRSSNELENAAEDAGEDAAEAAGESFGDKLKGLLDNAGTAAGLAVAGALVGSITEAMDQNSIANNLAAQLGQGPQKAAELGKITGQIYASNYGDSVGDVSEAVRAVWQNGLVDKNAATKDIEAVTKKAINLANVMGSDYDTVSSAISQMLKTGIAKSSDEAFDILTRGFQTGADKAGDLLDTFIEYPTQFRQLGLDGATAMGLIRQGLQGGARDADIVADAFKEFAIRATDGSKTSAEGFKAIGLNAEETTRLFAQGGEGAKKATGMVIDALNGMTDPVARNAAGVALFGTQWEDLGGAFRKFDVDTAVSGLGEVAGAADKVDAALGSSPQATIEMFRRQLTQTFVEVVGKNVIPVITSFFKWLNKHETVLKAAKIVLVALVAALVTYKVYTLAAEAATKAMAIATTLWTNAAKVAAVATKAWAVAQRLLTAAFVTSPIGLVVVAIAALVAAIVIAYKKSETFRDIVDAVWKGIKKAIEAVVDWFVKNAMPLVKKYLELAGEWFNFLWKLVQKVWDGIKKAFDVWWSFAKPWFEAVGAALKVLGEVFEWLYNNVIKPVWSGIQKVIEAWWAVISALWKTIISFLQTTFKAAWETYGALIKAVWNAMQSVIEAWWNVIKALWTAIITFLATTFKAAWDTFKAVVTAIWNALEFLIRTWWTVVSGIFNVIISFLATTFKAGWDAFQAMLTAVWNALEILIRTWWTVVSGIFNVIIAFLKTTFTIAWQAFQAMLTAVWNAIQLVITTVWAFLRDQIFTPIINFLSTTFTIAWQTFQAVVTAVWNAMQLAITTVWTFIRDQIFWPTINFLVGVLTPAWNTFRDSVVNAWNFLRDSISNTWNWIRDNIFSPIQTMITQTIPNAFNTGVQAIANAWNKVKAAAREPVYFVVHNIVNEGIIKALNWIGEKVGAPHINPAPENFASGGVWEGAAANGTVLPGWSPGRDIHEFVSRTGGRLRLSGGEAIMRPEFTKGVGVGFINFFNRLARMGGVGAVRRYFGHMHGRRRLNGPPDHGGWADGGIIEWMKKLFPAEGSQKPWTMPYFKKAKGDGAGWVSKAWGALTDPVGAFKDGVNSLLGGIPGGAWIKDMGKKSITKDILPKSIDWIKDKIKGIFDMGGTTSSITPIGGAGAAISSYTGLMAAIRQVFPDYKMWSGYRPGSRTLSGKLSYHAMGRAIDGPPIRAVAEWIVKTYGKSSKEIITPWRDLNWWHGKPHKYNTAVEAQHGVFGNNAHIHWAMRRGGIIPRLFDTGGLLGHRELGVNLSGRPERVLDPRETEAYDKFSLDDLIDVLHEVKKAVENVGKDVGGELKSASRQAVVRSRTA